MWDSKSKHDLIIEVWEKLDCESVGRTEIEAIETVVRENYGESPLDSPMRLARLLADEGAELRHSEILELDVERRTSTDELPVLSQPIEISTKEAAFKAIFELETLRRRFQKNGKNQSLQGLRKKAITARNHCVELSENQNKAPGARRDALEIGEWLSIWIQSPEIYETWIRARYPEGFEEIEQGK